MKKRALPAILIALVLLSGCNMSHTIIDWVDFVKVNGDQYESLYDVVLSDPALVTDNTVGTVRFNVNDNVHKTNYKVKDGDAAFLAEGTLLYEIEGLDPKLFIAVRDETMINGYKVYHNWQEGSGRTWHYSDLEQHSVQRIEVYDGYSGAKWLATHEGDSVAAILALLDASTPAPGYRPTAAVGDPAAVRFVFDDGGPIVQSHHIFKDDTNYYYYPNNLNLIDAAIGDYTRDQ